MVSTKFIVGSFILVMAWAAMAAQTMQPDLTIPLGTAKVMVDIYSPAQSIRILGLPSDTVGACTLYASTDETLEGQPYVPRHCWFGDLGGFYEDDWDFIPPNHAYDISVEYQTGDLDGKVTGTFRTPAVHVFHLTWEKP